MSYKDIPISTATSILKEFNKDEVIILSYDSETGSFTFTTDGTTEAHKINAANGAKFLIDKLQKSGTFGTKSTHTIVEDPNNRFSKP